MIKYSGSREYTQLELLDLIKKIKAIIYVRVSSTDQVLNYSLESQEIRCVQHAKARFDYKEDEMMVIVEPGESGDDPNRPGLNHVLYLLEQGVGRKVVMLHPNRMSRYLALQTTVSQRVWGRGCDLEFVEFEVDPDNPESMLMFNVQGSIAQYNKAKILADTDRGRKQMIANKKIPGLRRLYGYTYDKELDTIVENPEEKEAYLKMVNWVLEGITCSEVAERLSLDGVPAPIGDRWYQSTVSRILRNEVFTGTYHYGKTKILQRLGTKTQVQLPREQWYSIPVPRYIEDEKFEKLQKLLDGNVKKNRGAKTAHYLLKSLARCGRCGAAVGAAPNKNVGKGRIYYYGCTAKAKKSFKVGTGESNPVCRGRNWRQDIVDKQVWEYIIGRLENPDRIIEDVVKQQSDLRLIDDMKGKKERLEKKLKEKSNERKQIMFLFTRGTIRSETELDEMLQPVDEQSKRIEEELSIVNEALRNASMTMDELEKIKQSIEEFRQIIHLDDLTLEAKHMLVQRFVSNVILGEETIEIVTKWQSTMSPRQLIQ